MRLCLYFDGLTSHWQDVKLLHDINTFLECLSRFPNCL